MFRDNPPSSANRVTSLLPFMPALVIVAACGGSAEAGSAGDAGALDGPDIALDPQTEEVYTVGALEGEDWETFGNVSDVAFDDDGNLFLLDRDAGHIVMFSPTGEFVRTIGQQGDGPGELAGPLGLALMPGDRVVVFDFAKQGFQVFTTGGEFVESVALDPQEGLPGRELLVTPSGRLATHGGIRMSFNSDGGGLEEPVGRPIETFGLDGSRNVVYTAWESPPPEDEDEAELSGEGGRIQLRMQQTIAFEPGLHLGILPDGRMAVADSVGYRVKLLRDGTVVSTLERPVVPTVVDESIEEMERERRLAQLEEGGGSGRMMVVSASGGSGGNISVGRDQINEMMRGQIEGMGFAPEIPVIEDLAVDREGRIWVQRAGPMPGEDGPTDIITADGRYLGTIDADGLRIPAAFGPDGLVAYIERDELEVQRVRVARLQRDGELETGR
ncbi:MAG: 6-bladed beta-propeller [Gemmatimonadota bacterium]|nr:6-bladed beta-propeller [Gemmatimonadota bacterium]